MPKPITTESTWTIMSEIDTYSHVCSISLRQKSFTKSRYMGHEQKVLGAIIFETFTVDLSLLISNSHSTE